MKSCANDSFEATASCLVPDIFDCLMFKTEHTCVGIDTIWPDSVRSYVIERRLYNKRFGVLWLVPPRSHPGNKCDHCALNNIEIHSMIDKVASTDRCELNDQHN